MSHNHEYVPQLVMVEEPETKIRFRYKSEGGSHGGLVAKRKVQGKKIYPTVKLENYQGKKRVFIRVTLYTEDKKEHVLEFKGKKNGLHHIEEYLKNDGTATFTNLKILSKKRDEIEKLLMDRKLKNLRTEVSQCVKNTFEKKYSKEVKDRARAILNSVRLCFEAFEEGSDVHLCRLFSDIICNQKAASKGDLRIYRMSQIAGSYKGGDEVILLCDKVQKDNIKIRFYETDDDDNVIWKDYGVFSPVDVHFQVAIPFKTPAYRTNATKSVFVCLERNGEESEAREFTYKAEENPAKKRKYMPEQYINIPSPSTSGESCSPMSASSADSYSNEVPVFTNSFDPESLSSEVNSRIELSLPGLPNNMTFDHLCEVLGINENSVHQIVTEDSFEMNEKDDILKGYPLIFEHLTKPEENMNTNPMWSSSYEYPYGQAFDLSSIDGNITPFDFTGDQIQVDGNRLSTKPKQHTIQTHFEDDVQMYDMRSSNPDAPVRVTMTSAPAFPILEDAMESIQNLVTKLGSVSIKKVADTLSFIKFPHRKSDQDFTTCNQSDLQKKKIWSNILLSKDHYGNTLLHLALQKNRDIAPILKMNCILNSDIVNIQNYKEETALHLAVEEKKLELIKTLLKYGANPNIQNSGGNNCYHIAALKNSLNIMVSMLAVKRFPPDINAFSYEGLTPLHIAVMKNSVIQLELLKFPKTDVNLKERKSGRSSLHYAVQLHGSFINALLKKEDIDINIQDFDGNTPLHIACATENIEAVKELLEAGANPLFKNFKENFNDLHWNSSEDTSDGQTPADMTTNTEILQLLRNAVESNTEDQLSKQCFDNIAGTSEESNMTMEKLSNYLNEAERWKSISVYFIDEQFSNLEYSDNPAKGLLNFIKETEKEEYIDKLKKALELAGLTYAVKIIEEDQLDCI